MTMVGATRGVVVAAALLLAGCGRDVQAPERLVPELAEALPAIDAIRLEQGEADLVFERDGPDWRIREAAWRADRRWLQPLLLGLAEARCDEPRTADPARFGRIGVAWPPESPPQDGAAFARPVGRLHLTMGERHVRIVIGYPQARGGTFVRVEGAAHACLTRASLRLPASPAEWFDPQLWRVPNERVATVRIEEPAAPPLVLRRRQGRFVADGQVLALSPLPDAVAAALAAPRQSDVREAPADGARERVLRIELDDGGAYALALRREAERTWATVIEAPKGDPGFDGREFLLPVDVAEPLWTPRDALGAVD